MAVAAAAFAAAGPAQGVSPAVEVRELERSFGERPVLEGVSFDLVAGRTLAVLGANGAGKSTLLRVLAGLLRPHAGSVRVLGAALPEEGWRARARVGLLGHDSGLYRALSPRENLRFHARLHGVGRERVEELIDVVGLGSRSRDPVRELSRGGVQRLAVARAVLHDPPLLLLDEPRSGLDPGAEELVEPLVGRSSGRTRVVVTHDVEGALEECDTALGLLGGRPAFLAPPEALEPAGVRRELYR
ncbi:MAG: heme ABC exporter ATP-binding protein CcmA [Thermoleophilaceae bacterium]